MKQSLFSATSLAFLLVLPACSVPPSSDTESMESSSASVEDQATQDVSSETKEDSEDPSQNGETDDSIDEKEATIQGEVKASVKVDGTMQAPAPTEQTARTITITTKNFVFTPNAINVKQGEKITLRLQGTEGTHGFMVPELGINTPVAAGKTVDIVLPTDTAGSFNFRCSVPCGSGHTDMTGMITITE